MITLECNYSKKLGLPGYSSHQFSITFRTEIADLTQVQAESARLYKLLQEGGDNGIWSCSPKQQSLIQKIVTEHNLAKNEVETLAQDRFGKGVKSLNKLEASGLIEELLEKTGQSKGQGRSRYQNRFQQRTGAK